MTQTDKKQKYFGVLENPYVSIIHRNTLDGFKVGNLKKAISNFKIEVNDLLDIGCGWGEYSKLSNKNYCGVDDSFPRVKFGLKVKPMHQFIQASAVTLPFKDKSFEAVLLANTIHHLSDEQVLSGFNEIKRVTKKYFIIDDCVFFEKQNKLSKFFYSLDRGTMFRTSDQIEALINKIPGFKIIYKTTHMTTPWLYQHAVFVVAVMS